MRKNIFIYGDSITWGRIPGRPERYEQRIRFTEVVQDELGDDFCVIAEGLRGRTLSGENGFFPHRDGLGQFGPILASHLPLDLIVLFLGTNDVNSRSDKTANDTAESVYDYKKAIEWWCDHMAMPLPSLMLVSPPLICDVGDPIFSSESESRSAEFLTAFKAVADELGIDFLDAAAYVSPSNIDGVHLSKTDNRKLGLGLAKKIRAAL